GRRLHRARPPVRRVLQLRAPFVPALALGSAADDALHLGRAPALRRASDAGNDGGGTWHDRKARLFEIRRASRLSRHRAARPALLARQSRARPALARALERSRRAHPARARARARAAEPRAPAAARDAPTPRRA